jgi:hypothetical protein
VHLGGFYHMNISRCTVLRMSSASPLVVCSVIYLICSVSYIYRREILFYCVLAASNIPKLLPSILFLFYTDIVCVFMLLVNDMRRTVVSVECCGF